MAMAVLLSRFDIAGVDTADGGEVEEHLAFTMAPVGLRMRLRERAARQNHGFCKLNNDSGIIATYLIQRPIAALSAWTFAKPGVGTCRN